MTRSQKFSCFAGVGLSFGTAVSASAVLIDNNSFEFRYATSDNSATAQVVGADCCNPNSTIPGWHFASSGADGTQNQGVPAGAYGNPPQTDGIVWAFINGTGTVTYNGTSLGVIAPNTTYTLTVGLGNNRQDASNLPQGDSNIPFGRPGSYAISLTGNGAAIGGTGTTSVAAFSSGTTPTIPNDSFVDYSATYTSGADSSVDPFVGQTLGILLSTTGLGGELSQSLFDNVRLTASPVPEPTTLACLAFGGLGFLRRRRAR